MTENTSKLNYFFWRRLHSLSGIFPIGVFLLEHFFSNSYAFQGPEPFNEMVASLQGLPLVLFLEIGFIAVPILFHAILGFVIMYHSRSNVTDYGLYRNWMYFFQRVTGMIAIAFICYHVFETRIEAALEDRLVTYGYMADYFASSFHQVIYLIGIPSVCFHFANGLATAAITWGLTVSQRSQRIATILSWFVFAGMTFWGVSLLYAFN